LLSDSARLYNRDPNTAQLLSLRALQSSNAPAQASSPADWKLPVSAILDGKEVRAVGWGGLGLLEKTFSGCYDDPRIPKVELRPAVLNRDKPAKTETKSKSVA
jgi:hypothetical protein